MEPLEERKLKNETIILLGLIYRDFLCSADEKKKLQEKDAKELKIVQEEIAKELKEKYNPDNLFKNKKQEVQVVQETQLIIQEEKWYQKIIKRIKGIFRIR